MTSRFTALTSLTLTELATVFARSEQYVPYSERMMSFVAFENSKRAVTLIRDMISISVSTVFLLSDIPLKKPISMQLYHHIRKLVHN